MRKALLSGRFLRVRLIVICLLAILPFSGKAENIHDIHVSVADVKWNEDSGVFEVSIKIFIDDLELSLTQGEAPDLFIGTAKELQEADIYIARYLREHLRIGIDGEMLEPEFIGKEISDDQLAVWCYIEFPTRITRGKKCTIVNDTLFDLYDDQRNIMNIKMNKLHKEYIILQPGGKAWSYTY